MPDGAKWQIVFYSKKTGAISRKRGYKSKRDADAALLETDFCRTARSGLRKAG